MLRTDVVFDASVLVSPAVKGHEEFDYPKTKPVTND